MVELLVAMVLGGIIVTALFELLSSQGRFVEMQSSREEVQQNTRAALELIGSELRTVPGGEALVSATADSITFRTSRLWGVVCDVPSATQLDVVFPTIVANSLSTNSGTGIVVELGGASPAVWSSAAPVTAIGSAAPDCDGILLASQAERRSLTLASQPISGGVTPQEGDVVYLYDEVTYRTGTSASVPGVWIQRRLGNGSNQPMAGPVDEALGLQFAYFDAPSGAPLATPLTTAAAREAVTRIQVVVDAIARNSQGGGPESKADTVVISLRNRV